MKVFVFTSVDQMDSHAAFAWIRNELDHRVDEVLKIVHNLDRRGVVMVVVEEFVRIGRGKFSRNDFLWSKRFDFKILKIGLLFDFIGFNLQTFLLGFLFQLAVVMFFVNLDAHLIPNLKNRIVKFLFHSPFKMFIPFQPLRQEIRVQIQILYESRQNLLKIILNLPSALLLAPP